MKKAALKEDVRRPIDLQLKIEEMKKTKDELLKVVKENTAKEIPRESTQKVLKADAVPVSLKLKQVHALGDVVGRFHPSKSRKGIKRSE